MPGAWHRQRPEDRQQQQRRQPGHGLGILMEIPRSSTCACACGCPTTAALDLQHSAMLREFAVEAVHGAVGATEGQRVGGCVSGVVSEFSNSCVHACSARQAELKHCAEACVCHTTSGSLTCCAAAARPAAPAAAAAAVAAVLLALMTAAAAARSSFWRCFSASSALQDTAPPGVCKLLLALPLQAYQHHTLTAELATS